MERQTSSQTTGPANRTVSVMTRLEPDGNVKQNSTGKIVRPSKTKRPGCAAKVCRSHRNHNSLTGQQEIEPPARPVHPSSATSLQQTNISCPPSRQLSFQEPRKVPQRSSYQQSAAKANSSPYGNIDRYIPCPKQQQPQEQQPVICICSTGQNQLSNTSPELRQPLQRQQQVIPTYPIPPYATNYTENYAGKKSVAFCSENPSTYSHKFISPCRCGQYHEYQAELLLPRPYRQASAIFQRVPETTPTQFQQNQPTFVQACYGPGTQRSYMNEPNYLIREQPTRDNDMELGCMCAMQPGTLPSSRTRTPPRPNSSSFKVSPLGYTQMDDCGCMEAVEQPDTICLPCGHTFPEGPKDTCWRVKIMKDVGSMTKGLEFGIQTQTSETRIINADKLEELLPPEARFNQLTDNMDPTKQQVCAPCLEAAQSLSEGCCPPCNVRISDEIRYENGSLTDQIMPTRQGSITSQGKRFSQDSQGNMIVRSPRTSTDRGSARRPDDCCTECPEYEEHLQRRGKRGCVIM